MGAKCTEPEIAMIQSGQNAVDSKFTPQPNIHHSDDASSRIILLRSYNAINQERWFCFCSVME